MPYIDPKARPEFDKLMGPLIDRINSLPLEERDGVVDYILTRMLKSLYGPPFFNYNRAIGIITATLFEYYRTVVGPYEDEKIKQSGDVEAHGQPGEKEAA